MSAGGEPEALELVGALVGPVDELVAIGGLAVAAVVALVGAAVAVVLRLVFQ